MLDNKLARAISSDVRRQILRILALEQKITVQEIADKLDITLSAASKHLKFLYDLKLIRYEKDAQKKFYSLEFTDIIELNDIYSRISNKLQWNDMETSLFKIKKNKAIIRITDFVCETSQSLITSPGFKVVVEKSLDELRTRNSVLMSLFGDIKDPELQKNMLLSFLEYLVILPIEKVVNLVPNSEIFLKNKETLFNYIEYLYNFWRSYDRFVISIGNRSQRYDQRPYRVFNSTIETLTHIVRQTYRDIQENITHEHPNVYRQIRAGAGFACIALPLMMPMAKKYIDKVSGVSIIRQILLNPPIVLSPPTNKRTGGFLKVDKNPTDFIEINSAEWLCYPAKVGELTILVYFNEDFYDLGFSLANLFEIATDEDLKQKPDGIYFFGISGEEIDKLGKWSTVFYDDIDNNMIVAAVPGRSEYGYFGYLKKMILTIHNVIMMKKGILPFHGSLTRIIVDGEKDRSILVIGDTGAGKSETLEAFRNIGGKLISDIIIIADDMGSISVDNNGDIIGRGTEIGAFLRLDDLSPSSTFGAIDRAIFMSINQVNSRVVIPVTDLYHVQHGVKIDMILYANNYEEIDDQHPIIEKFSSAEEALNIFREGAAMSKGTTTSTGLQKTYFVNPFGIPSYKELHEELAIKYFNLMFDKNVFIGQLRTRLGIKGMEKEGPLIAAEYLMELIKNS